MGSEKILKEGRMNFQKCPACQAGRGEVMHILNYSGDWQEFNLEECEVFIKI